MCKAVYTADQAPLIEFHVNWFAALSSHSCECFRYCYKNQIHIGQWNCAQLGSALVAAGLCPQVRRPCRAFCLPSASYALT